jgi:toxin ParE1/3/4
MTREVLVTEDAARDLEELYDYLAEREVPGRADHVLGRLEEAFSRLAANPERGAYPKELLAVGLREYREIYFKPYRIIYRVFGPRVVVMLIADGRRNMQALLQRRLLRG